MNTTLRNKMLLFCISLICSANIFAQANEKPATFKAARYPKDKYDIKLDTFGFSKFHIELRQVKLIDGKAIAPTGFYCRGWVTITQGNKKVKEFYFKNIDAVGGCSGLFVPAVQPRKDHFIISKFGDYDGSIIIIDSSGKVIQKKGGVFYISKDNRYLFSSYDSDMPGLTVYDMVKKRILFSGDIEPEMGDWYFQGHKYFAVVNDDAGIGKIKIINFDLAKNNIVITTTNQDYPKKENKLSIFNDVVHASNCNCGR